MFSVTTPGSVSVIGRLCFSLIALMFATTGINGTVHVSTPPVVEAEIGKPINITCVPEISTPSSMKYVQWFVNEKNLRKRIYFQDGENRIIDNETDYTGRIKVDENYTLTISPVELRDEQTFLCQVGAGPAGSGEGTTELKVFDAPELPEILPNEASISVLEKEPSQIATCHTRNGYPAPNITWYKDRTPLQATTKMDNKMYVTSQAVREPSGLYTIVSTLHYAPEKKDKDSKFYCEVSYRMPSGVDKMKESEKISVSINYPTENVEFVFQPSVLKESDNVSMECRSDGSSNVEYTFYRVQGGEEEILESIGNTLELSRVQRMDSGVYGCKVLDFDVLHKDFNANKTIIINYLDSIKLDPKGPYTFMVGVKDKTIHCSAKASEQTSVIWKKHKKTISLENVLHLPMVTFDDSGMYTCEVTVQNIPNLKRQKSINIIVKGSPEVNCMQNTFYKKESYVNLTCIFKGNPAPNVTCMENDRKKMLAVRTHQQNSYTTVSELILQLTEEMLKVTCNGTNKHGSKTHNFTVDGESAAVSTRSPTAESAAVSTRSPTAGSSNTRSSGGMLIIVIIVCIIILAFLGAVLYFLYKKGKIPCGRSGKQDITRTDAHDDIVVEVKNDQKVPEETVLLQGVNGEKKPPNDQ